MENFNFTNYEQDAIAALLSGQPLGGKEGVLAPLIKRFLEGALAAELASHINLEKEKGVSNRKNGQQSKQVQVLQGGKLEINSSRDRNGTFTPQIIEKRQVFLSDDLQQKILYMYGKGASLSDISGELSQIYGVDASPALISEVTNTVLPLMREWRTRPLDAFYCWIYLDAMVFNVRDSDGKVVKKALNLVYGVNSSGIREVLGMYISLNEGAKFWLSVLDDLSKRGVKDILFACVDGLKGFPEAIEAIFPQTQIQICIVHQVRHSLRFVVSKDYKEVLTDLKAIYQAPDRQTAEDNLAAFESKYHKSYPTIVASWKNNWHNLATYFEYPFPIRKAIYTTNPIEGFNRQIRKVTKSKASFPSDDALYKLVYLIIQDKTSNNKINDWGKIASQLAILFPQKANLLFI